MANKVRWGILGCGVIAGQFADDLAYSQHGFLQAVASRSSQKAQDFARQKNALRARGSYEDLVRDPEVDIVYVATPHPFHMDHTLLALAAGKPVLCEKPIALNARQLSRMIKAATERKLFLMEAMWTRCFPAVEQVSKWLADKRIGQVRVLEADFGINSMAGPEHRINNLQLGGGALLDLGIYVVSLASLVFGRQPEKISSSVHFSPTRVDDQSALLFEYEDGASAVLLSSSRVYLRPEARIYGTAGRIILHEHFYRPGRVTLEMEGKNPETLTFPHPGLGLQYEADHAAECLQNLKVQSSRMPLDESLAIMKTMDKIRRQWKFKYPQEE